MTSFGTVENKISSIKAYFKIVKKLRKFSKEQVKNDEMVRAAVERYLYLICQSAIDLADMIISLKKGRKPIDQKDSFIILVEDRIISESMSKPLTKMVGFRNILAHEYAKIDYSEVYDILHNQIEDISKFVIVIEKKILK